MRFHVVSLPHTQTTKAFSACAFTEKVRKFCIMMKGLGHEVVLYAGEANEAPCDELVTCISEAQRKEAEQTYGHYTAANFDSNLPQWRTFNTNCVGSLRHRLKPQDFICIIGGLAQKEIADAFPGHMTVEFGIGYEGTFAKYRVWESYAWMHSCYPFSSGKTPSQVDGVWFDAVIPSYFEPELFPLVEQKADYYLFIGRLIDRKGFKIAVEVCKTLGVPLKVAGFGEAPSYGEYVGVVGAEERGRLMSNAKAVFVPTVYIEPFGSVAVEAHLCGTPTITTDWGAFTETVVNGFNGYRCRTLSEFKAATLRVDQLVPGAIREHALARYSLDVVAKQYQAYFERLMTLWGKGWYA